jgi:polar amino acid transport system substrate-binding protein
VLINASQALASEDSISLSAAEYPPYYSKDLPNYGPVTELIVRAFNKSGYEVNIHFYPWLRGELLAQNGTHDGMIPPWHSKEREAAFVFSEPLFQNELYFYKQKNTHITFNHLQDLKKYRIGSVKGYANPAKLTNAGIKFEDVLLDRQNLLKLSIGRLDLALIDVKVAEFLIKTDTTIDPTTIERMEPMIESKMQFLTISKKTENYQKKLTDFNEGLKQLRSSGEYDKILSKHGL